MAESRRVLVGTITKYYPEKGNGFITLDSGELAYFTNADMPPDEPLEVREGRTVTFNLEEQRELRPRARKITLIE